MSLQVQMTQEGRPMTEQNHAADARATLERLEELSPEMFQLIGSLAAVYLVRADETSEKARTTQPQFEAALREATMTFEKGVHTEDLERLDVDVPGVVVDGVRYYNIGKSRQEVLVSSGKIYPRLTVYRGRGEHRGSSVVPAAMSFGLVAGHVSLTAAQICQLFVAETTPRAAAQLLRKMGTMTPSKSWLGNITKEVGKAWETNRQAFEEIVRVKELSTLPSRDLVNTFQLSLDGVMVRDKDAPNTVGAKKSDPRPKGHREAYSACICLLNSDGERLKTIAFARMYEAKKVTLVEQLIDEVRNLQAFYPDVRWAVVADAAAENWRMVTQIEAALSFKFGKKIVDFFHGAEHLVDGLKAGGVTDDTKQKYWRDVLKLQPDGAERCLVELNRLKGLAHAKRSKKRQATIDRQITYFNNNQDMMGYIELLDDGYPIGSGVQEALGKTIIVQRTKRSGMSWRRPGGQSVLTPRALHHSDRLEHAWAPLRAHFRRPWALDLDTKRKAPPWSRRWQSSES